MSRFDDLLKNAKGRAPGATDARAVEVPPSKLGAATSVENRPPALPSRRPGRPPGKKSDPAYEQVTAYIPRKLYGRVRGVLWNDHDRKEFSALVAELLTEWLDGQTSG
jgi:hypothetical protein